MGLEDGPLALTKIESSSDYKSKEETSTGFILPLYISSPPTSPLSSSSTDFSPFYTNMSQHDLNHYE